MQAPSTARRVLLVLLSTLVLMLSATLAFAVVFDYQARGLVPNGVTVVGVDLSGMTESAAREAIEDAVSTPMMRPVTVTGDAKTWTLDPQNYVTIDTDAMLAEAYSPRRAATLAQRLNSQVTGSELPVDVQPVYSVDASAIASWVTETAAQVDRKPKNASRKIVDYKFKIKKSVPGARLDQAATAATITAALSADAALNSDTRIVSLPIKPIKAKIHEKDFKTAIIVSLSQCKIRLYKGDKLVKTYLCAPGRAAFPTPTGDFKIMRKLRYAPWINPGSDWAKSMPAVIPAGPSNPMGVTKIGINYPGIYMHGIPPGEFGSIGTHASHGCMRMMPSTVLDLYGRVKVGDPVYIRP
ncbi:MAG: L,D-transpeptidase family protein [Coriobacteriia bacterium]|nr:L,D-transpeptidase family protein [Coriobacteriia bacterium]